MTTSFIRLSLLFSLLFAQQSWSRDADWFQQRMLDLDHAEQLQDPDQKIEEFAKYMGIGANPNRDSEQDAVFKRALSGLLAIPSHAKHYEDKLEAAKKKLNPATGEGYMEYREAQREIISSLYHVPSHSTVEVMGRLLNDPEDRDKKPLVDGAIVRGDYSSPIPCYLASNVMKNMGIENPPKVQNSPDGLAQVDAWKDWWNEIKAGKRTYRFIGSPIEYGPDGPVAAKEVSRREHDRQSGSNRGSNGSLNADADPPNAQSTLWSKIVGGGAALLLLIGAWFAFGRRSANSHS